MAFAFDTRAYYRYIDHGHVHLISVELVHELAKRVHMNKHGF